MRSSNTAITGIIAYLLQDGLLDAETAAAAYKGARQLNMPHVSYLVRFHLLAHDLILDYCAKQFGLPVFPMQELDKAILARPLIPAELIFRYRVMPIKIEQASLHLGITDPTDQTAINAISFHTGLRITCWLVSEIELNDAINEMLSKLEQPTVLHSQLASTLSKLAPFETPDPKNETAEHSDEPVSVFVGNLLQEAIEKHVSDIHIEPFETHCRIRFRRDGLLYEAASSPLHLAERVIMRLKIMATIDIAERRLPQDGRLQMRRHDKIDIRVNTCPALYGEKLVLRLLNTNTQSLNLSALGLTKAQHNLLLEKLHAPQGLILVTGPTGSGKTLTLYAALQHLNHIEKNIASVEDSVEIELAGITQINVNTKIGLNFSTVLRTLLRQDPDIIMVGEVRDLETAQIAMQAAQTGHLVLSTLHTNSALETISRLQAMGIHPYQIASSLSLMIAQRLLRKLCEHCKIISDTEVLPGTVTYQAKGCKHCHHGYHGRVGIFEILPMTKSIAQLVLAGASVMDMQAEAKKQAWQLLWDAGLDKVKNGQTSYEELIRVAGEWPYREKIN
jgi:type IV pilus assembly protein PilB